MHIIHFCYMDSLPTNAPFNNSLKMMATSAGVTTYVCMYYRNRARGLGCQDVKLLEARPYLAMF